MTERPIIFDAASMRALLAGHKTQTRRLVHARHLDHLADVPCPYGVPGDRLWCRETWGLHRHFDLTDWNRGPIRGDIRDDFYKWELDYRADWMHEHEPNFWRSPISMPRWASRLTLWLVEERVERLQSISESDARAEGFERASGARGQMVPCPPPNARDAFAEAWDRINGKRAPWSSSPWVWVLGFRLVK